MAADSSSSDDEELKKCQEAVWDTQVQKRKDADSNVKESKRVVVADHEHDGNELQVTKGFQTHVAKKLGHYLDSCLSETQPKNSKYLGLTNCEDGDDDGGFRLFSTSIPGQKVIEPPAPARRRPVPSSSDSDSEMESRLKEAAVSVEDLLPASTLASSSAESVSLEKIKENTREGEEKPKKKKKRKKQSNEESEQNAACDSTQSNGSSVGTHSCQGKKKKKRKEIPEEKA
ncbi:uncharacterized protein FQA47_017140 [Oryzias melastigma]|uniref:Protein CUSTOS n=1 Tax=Oryzias melastigma TaxID=30732 RepID=A0A834C9H7_ORYME|nr:uncharacterized protein FQA47_017140 [Oryzias melastigma]